LPPKATPAVNPLTRGGNGLIPTNPYAWDKDYWNWNPFKASPARVFAPHTRWWGEYGASYLLFWIGGLTLAVSSVLPWFSLQGKATIEFRYLPTYLYRYNDILSIVMIGVGSTICVAVLLAAPIESLARWGVIVSLLIGGYLGYGSWAYFTAIPIRPGTVYLSTGAIMLLISVGVICWGAWIGIYRRNTR